MNDQPTSRASITGPTAGENIRLHLQWMAVNSLAWFVSIGAGAMAAASLYGLYSPASFIVAGTISGLSIGFMQSFTVLSRFASVRTFAWCGGTLAAAALLAVTAVFIPDRFFEGSFLFWGFLSGLLAGAFQWLALRRQADRAVWWIPANAVAAPAGLAVLMAIMREVDSFTTVLLAVAAGGAVAGAIHGIALAWILHPLPRTRGGDSRKKV